MSDRVFIAGGGSREHALAWHLAQSPHVEAIHGASNPANVGIAKLGAVALIDPTDTEGLLKYAKNEGIDFAIASMDNSLEAGMVDAFTRCDIPTFGPTRAAAKLEWSKVWAYEFMTRHKIPTPFARNFLDPYSARKYQKYRPWEKTVGKADGLAKGKGATVPGSEEEAIQAINDSMIEKIFGSAGEKYQIQDRIGGKKPRDLSVFIICDGENYIPLGIYQDYKRLYDGNKKRPNPNTGGMASDGPVEVDSETIDVIDNDILVPTVHGMAEEGKEFRGVLFVGIIMTPDGPKVIEYNVRFGSPEFQAMVLSFGEDLYPLLHQSAYGKFTQDSFKMLPGHVATIVLAAKGYPYENKIRTGDEIFGLDKEYKNMEIFHAGTQRVSGSDKIETSGGRALNLSSRAETGPEAVDNIVKNIGKHAIHFKGMHYRKKIAKAA